MAPESTGWASDGKAWAARQLDDAVELPLNGGSDDETFAVFVSVLND